MVGRLAVAVAVAAAAAAVPEKDGAVQPRKKRREEDGSAEAITRYFSPLAKAAGKASPPHKAADILGYFRKAPAARGAPVGAAGIGGGREWPAPPARLEGKRKRVHLSDKRGEGKELGDECPAAMNGDGRGEALRLKGRGTERPAAPAPGGRRRPAEGSERRDGFPGTATCVKGRERAGSEERAAKSRIRRTAKRKRKVNVDLSGDLSPESQLNEKCRKEEKDKRKRGSPEVAECDVVSSDSSFEVRAGDMTAKENGSVITVSFEDFLKSQGEISAGGVEEGTKPMLDSPVTVNEADRSDSTGDPERCEESQQLPLRTVTVLAQVHSVPPRSASLHNDQKGSKKIASIFLKQKVYAEEEGSPPLLESEPTEQVMQKRKSNVVIEEEELELAILETAGSDSWKVKSTLEERHQFMKAFRQPTSDGRKSGVKKAHGKAKQVTGKSSKDKKGPEGDSVPRKVFEGGLPGEDDEDKYMQSSAKNARTKTRRPKTFQKKGNKRNKALGAKENCVSRSDYNEDKELLVSDQLRESNLDVIISSSPKVNELRRSLRQTKMDRSKTVTPKKNRSTFPEDERAWPVQTSTPKASKQSWRKDSVYKAEVITVPSDENSPIRMRFTRISATIKSNKGEAVNNEELNSRTMKISSASQNISKAKQLVEKAKAVRHSRSKAPEDSAAPVRRSSRQRALAERRTLQGNEKSVIALGSSQSNDGAAVQNTKQKNLRSLNEVLGKKSKNLKVSKSSNGKLGCVPSFPGRNAQKSAGEPVVIFDDSSRDASENSQDDDQFRAKREFLMSGLPELLRRQIAKKAAAMEAYGLASSCFRAVVHVQQKDFCPMWELKAPLCPLLTELRELSTEVTDVTKIAVSLGEFSTAKSEPTGSRSAPVVTCYSVSQLSGRRPAFSEAFRKGLLDEIVSCNSQFPVRKYFYKFLKRQTERSLSEHSARESRDASSNSEEIQKRSDNWKETKRKRKEKEDQKSKRRKQTENAETQSESRVSRSLITPVPGGEAAAHLERSRSQKAEDTEHLSETNALSGVEDMLWTEKYQPQDSSELVGNKKEIERLHSWLKEWKKRADWEEKRNQKGEKEDKEHQDSLDSLDFKDDKSDIEEENNLCNTVLITGPPGVGKTAAVYACAQELGFKIFEVNASCQRSGRQILSQLKEATQSHQVDKKGTNAHKPCFFNSCSSAKSPKKVYSPKKVISPRKPPLSPKGAGLKRSLPPKTLANYFKMHSRCKGNDGTVTSQEKNKVLHPSAGNAQNSCEEKGVQLKSANKEVEEGEHNRKSATSLILFEEVDIIFDEDAGFLSAIKTFMATAKRPVILTTNDPTFSLMFDGYFEEINFRTPSLMNAASYLQVLCLAENLRADVKDLAALLTTNNCDIRQSVLYLQFWVRSGGGYLKDKRLALHGEDETATADRVINPEKTTDPKTGFFQDDAPPQEFPGCDTGCVETLLGLKNILLPSEDLFRFLKQKITTRENWDKLVQLLTEFQLKKVDFIYSNLECLLPLPVNYLSHQSEASNSVPERTTVAPSKNTSSNSYCSGKSSPGKKSKKTKIKKRLEELDDSDLFDTALNYSAEFITLPSDSPAPCAEVNKEESELLTNRKGKEMISKTPSKERRSALVLQCLNSLTEFVEDMSFLDCCVNRATKDPLEFSEDEGFNWMNGKIKNGLCDEFSIEHTDQWSSQSCSEIKAAIEALSFNKCSASISKNLEASVSTSNTPESDRLEGLTLHMSGTRNSVSFHQSADLSILRKARKRLAVIRAVFSRSPLNLGNKQASILEYLPTLRSICRSEKLKEQGKTKRRFLHYLEGIHLEIPRQAMNSLSLDFP